MKKKEQQIVDAVLEKYGVINHKEQLLIPSLSRYLFISHGSYNIEVNDITVTFRKPEHWTVQFYINVNLIITSVY